jgi:hypothetical protein
VQEVTEEQDTLMEFADHMIAHVPPKGRMTIWAIELNRQIGNAPTIADIVEGSGLPSETVARARVLSLLEKGLIAWDEDGIRVTLPGGIGTH